jgi:hypothetical protein
MRTIKGVVLGLGVMALVACTQTAEQDELTPVELDDTLDPQGKTTRAPSHTMTCAQATGGCAPIGFRNVNCALSNLKANTYVVVCVKGGCPAVYGNANAKGEVGYPEQKVATDGTARAFFSVRPDATYSFTTYSGAPKPGTVMASASASVSSSIGVDTQCGGEPVGCY